MALVCGLSPPTAEFPAASAPRSDRSNRARSRRGLPPPRWARRASASLAEIERDQDDERGDEQEDRVHRSLLGSRSGDPCRLLCAYRTAPGPPAAAIWVTGAVSTRAHPLGTRGHEPV